MEQPLASPPDNIESDRQKSSGTGSRRWHMVMSEPLTELPAGAGFHAAPLVVVDRDFDTRWNAWVARGRVHEQRVRRRFVVSAGVLAVGAAILYAFLRS
jgi:hypothetical protein